MTYAAILLDAAEQVFGNPGFEGPHGMLFMWLEDPRGAQRSDLRWCAHMVVEVWISGSERSAGIVGWLYGFSAERLTATFVRIVPGYSWKLAVGAYLFASGARMMDYPPSGPGVPLGVARATRWSYWLLVPFAAPGIRALVGVAGIAGSD